MLVSSEDCVKLADFGLSRWIDERDYYSGLYLYLLSSYLSDCFLKQLKRAGVPHAHLLHFYLAVIRPVLEYAAPVWHHSLNKRTKQYKKRQYESYLVAHVTCLIDTMCFICCWTQGLKWLRNGGGMVPSPPLPLLSPFPFPPLYPLPLLLPFP